MKAVKKLLAAFLAGAMVLCLLTGCGGGKWAVNDANFARLIYQLANVQENSVEVEADAKVAAAMKAYIRSKGDVMEFDRVFLRDSAGRPYFSNDEQLLVVKALKDRGVETEGKEIELIYWKTDGLDLVGQFIWSLREAIRVQVVPNFEREKIWIGTATGKLKENGETANVRFLIYVYGAKA